MMSDKLKRVLAKIAKESKLQVYSIEEVPQKASEIEEAGYPGIGLRLRIMAKVIKDEQDKCRETEG